MLNLTEAHGFHQIFDSDTVKVTATIICIRILVQTKFNIGTAPFATCSSNIVAKVRFFHSKLISR